MNKDTKKKIKNHFIYTWYIYLLLIAVVIAVESWAVSFKLKAKSNEKVTIFIGALNVENEKLENVIRENTDDGLIEINILDYKTTDDYFSICLTTAGTYGTDFIIVPIELIDDVTIQMYFTSLNDLNLNEVFNYDFSYYQIGDLKYGINVFDKANEFSLFSKYIKYVSSSLSYEDYYLFINRETCNMNDIYKTNSKKTSNYATEALKAMLENGK